MGFADVAMVLDADCCCGFSYSLTQICFPCASPPRVPFEKPEQVESQHRKWKCTNPVCDPTYFFSLISSNGQDALKRKWCSWGFVGFGISPSGLPFCSEQSIDDYLETSSCPRNHCISERRVIEISVAGDWIILDISN